MYEPRTDDHLYVRSRPLSELSRHRAKQIDALKGQETEIVVSRLVRNCGGFWSLRRSSMGTTAERTTSRWVVWTTTGRTNGGKLHRPLSFLSIDYTVRRSPVARTSHVRGGVADRTCAVNAYLLLLVEPCRRQACSVKLNGYYG